MFDRQLNTGSQMRKHAIGLYAELAQMVQSTTEMKPIDRLIILAIDRWTMCHDVDDGFPPESVIEYFRKEPGMGQGTIDRLCSMDYLELDENGLKLGNGIDYLHLYSQAINLISDRLDSAIDQMTEWGGVLSACRIPQETSPDVIGAGQVHDGVLIDKNLRRAFVEFCWDMSVLFEKRLGLSAQERVTILMIESARLKRRPSDQHDVNSLAGKLDVSVQDMSDSLGSLIGRGMIHMSDDGLVCDEKLVTDVYDIISEIFLLRAIPLVHMIRARRIDVPQNKTVSAG